MRKYKTGQYFILFFLYSAGLITTCLVPSLSIIQRAKTNEYVRFNDLDIFINVMATHTNYLSDLVIISFYILSFILGLNTVFFKTNPCFITRLKSRNEYIKKHIIDAILLALMFSFLLESINVVYSFCVFGADLTLSKNLIPYSVIDFISEFLYYMRVGIVLFLVGIILNKRLAAFITFGIYAFEILGDMFLLKSTDLWLPYKDAVIVTKLLTGDAQTTGIVPIIIRGVIINTILIVLAYYLFKKKDIIENEKKQNTPCLFLCIICVLSNIILCKPE